MPALNIRFSEEELQALRYRAETEGIPVARLVHDVAVCDTQRANFDAEVANVEARVIELSSDLLRRLADR